MLVMYGILTQERDEEVLEGKANRFGLSVFPFGDDSDRKLAVGVLVTPQEVAYQLEVRPLPELARLQTERRLLAFQQSESLTEPIKYYTLVNRF